MDLTTPTRPENMETALVFVDIETMGLGLEAPIVEVALVLTDVDLCVFETYHLVVPYEQREWVSLCDGEALKMHHDNGLMYESVTQFELLNDSKVLGTIDTRLRYADAMLLHQLVKWGIVPRHGTFAGNSIYMDRMWLRRQMPRVDAYMHYRQIDVSAVRELASRWITPNLSTYLKNAYTPVSHRAMADARYSIWELGLYRDLIFKQEGQLLATRVAAGPGI